MILPLKPCTFCVLISWSLYFWQETQSRLGCILTIFPKMSSTHYIITTTSCQRPTFHKDLFWPLKASGLLLVYVDQPLHQDHGGVLGSDNCGCDCNIDMHFILSHWIFVHQFKMWWLSLPLLKYLPAYVPF